MEWLILIVAVVILIISFRDLDWEAYRRKRRSDGHHTAMPKGHEK